MKRLLKFTSDDELPIWLRGVEIIPNFTLYVVIRKTKDKQECFKTFLLNDFAIGVRSIVASEVRHARKLIWDKVQHYNETGNGYER